MKKGFTLAEVLITLMIIGIVAALTIPSVISNYQQQEFKTGLKKAVSVLNEAIQMNIAQDGETPYDNSNIFKYLQRHMSVLDDGHYRYENGNPFQVNEYFFTTDGMRFESPVYNDFVLHESGLRIGDMDVRWGIPAGSYKGECGSYGLANNPNDTKYPPCIVLVDVNGDKKPSPQISSSLNSTTGNTDYRALNLFPSPTDKKLTDIFNIMITEDRAIPFGVVAQRAMYSK